MMSRMLKAALAALPFLVFAWASTAQAHPEFGTTVDFDDYVLFDKESAGDIYSLELYERRLKEIAELGFKRVYLRVNCLGLTLYPTKVARMYGDGHLWHWDYPVEAQRVIKTIRTYDVCRETIRICHKYGMEAYAWESLADGGPIFPKYASVARFGEAAAATRGAPLSDPFFFDEHPECYAMRNPRLSPDRETADRLNAAAHKHPIAKIVCTELEMRPPLRIKGDSIVIYTSDDNMSYQRYDKPFRFDGGVNADGFNTFTLSGLDIKANFVKFGHVAPYDRSERTYTFAMHGAPNQMQVYNSQGEEIAAVWHANIIEPTGEQGVLDLSRSDSSAWDYGNREIGFCVGAAFNPALAYHVGVPEYNVPLAMEHQLARFAELAAYPFDGFMMNIRTHSHVSHPEEYGFNPEVREIYLKRYGKDIWTEDFDLGKLLEIRGEGIARFYKGCKKLCGDRPFWISCTPPAPLGEKSVEKAFRGMGTHQLAYIPWLYRTYFRDGSVDGVMMIGGDFSDYFTPEVTGGREVKLGVFRECGGHLMKNPRYYPADYDFKADMTRLYNNPRLACVELYETMTFNFNPALREAIRQVLRPTQKP